MLLWRRLEKEKTKRNMRDGCPLLRLVEGGKARAALPLRDPLRLDCKPLGDLGLGQPRPLTRPGQEGGVDKGRLSHEVLRADRRWS